jgi:hypothetical protein
MVAAHPDKGGNNAKFIAAHFAWTQAKATVEKGAPNA